MSFGDHHLVTIGADGVWFHKYSWVSGYRLDEFHGMQTPAFPSGIFFLQSFDWLFHLNSIFCLLTNQEIISFWSWRAFLNVSIDTLKRICSSKLDVEEKVVWWIGGAWTISPLSALFLISSMIFWIILFNASISEWYAHLDICSVMAWWF